MDNLDVLVSFKKKNFVALTALTENGRFWLDGKLGVKPIFHGAISSATVDADVMAPILFSDDNPASTKIGLAPGG